MNETLRVYSDVNGQPVLAGVAHFTRRRGNTSTTFTYDQGYLAGPRPRPVDPNFPLVTGGHHTTGLPGAFQDCAPDRWGRNLINKRIRAVAVGGGRTPPEVSDVDYLTGVADLTRQGALRFRREDETSFLDPNLTVPKLVSLPRLLHASDRVALDADDMAAIGDLLDAGSGSLGGARPKASVQADDGRLLLAKFPHSSDEWDVMAWEKTALDLAERSGIPAPDRRLISIGGRNVLLLDRFDRTSHGHRVGYVSAMTLVDGQDGDQYDYANIADYLPEYGRSVDADLSGLFRRAAFSVAIHNTDDHLRNHGFLDGPGGWALSPAFDLNPNPDSSKGRVTTINAARLLGEEADGLKALAADCRLKEDEARGIISEVTAAAAGWRDAAAANGISERERSQFEEMFRQLQAVLRPLTGS